MAKKSKFDLAIVDRVKKIRTEKGFTQDDLAMFLNVSRGFIGQIESPNSQSKYSLEQLNRLAIEMNRSPRDFIPEKPVPETGRAKK